MHEYIFKRLYGNSWLLVSCLCGAASLVLWKLRTWKTKNLTQLTDTTNEALKGYIFSEGICTFKSHFLELPPITMRWKQSLCSNCSGSSGRLAKTLLHSWTWFNAFMCHGVEHSV